ncbi:MAG: D-2-hydroxyacid dehydrogenase [Planctomycetota bacterium]|nr:D-2-hydroxyacid dehydrogenase [Planctomycetota bacterium]
MPTRIICLDGYTLNPGDISWKPFQEQGDLVVHDRTPADQIVARAAGAPLLLTNKVPLSAATLAQLPEARYIGVLATGYNIVDTAAAAKQGIKVTNVPSYSTESVAQHTIGLLLECARQIGRHDRAVHEGKWVASPDFCFSLGPLVELNGRTLGVVGLGKIGLAVARIAAAMGMRIAAVARAGKPTPSSIDGIAVEWVPSMDDLFAKADVVTLHCPLTDKTRHLVDARRLGLMKPGAIVLNTGRGPLVDSQALAEALQAGRIAGAGLDVLDVEPPPASNPLLGAPRCVITPHLAWCALESRQRLMRVAAENLRAFLAGRPVNVVN